MLEILKIFPVSLMVLTFILVIIPSLISGLIRYNLYQYLTDISKKIKRLLNNENLGIQPSIVNRLQTRFIQTSQNLEQINTIALIQGIYDDENFNLLGFKISCEQGQAYTKTIPNLLLAFGLLGTFWGITTNLYNISEIINEGNNNIVDLTNQLQNPLRSMGVAFITSLTALLFSSFLTVINLKYNTNIVKYSVINYLEDYFDNIYKIKVQGDTRLDKAVNRMVEQQKEFLIRFHDNVGAVLEKTFKQAADRIANQNEKSHQLAEQVYQRLLESSAAINTGALTFKESMIKLEQCANTFQSNLPIFSQSCFSLKESTNIFNEAADKIQASKFSENLENLTVKLASTQTEFTDSVITLNTSIKEVEKSQQLTLEISQEIINHSQLINTSTLNFNESVIKLQQCANTFQSNLPIFSQSCFSLKESTNIFNKVAHKIETNKFSENLENTTRELAQTQANFAQTTQILSNNIPEIIQQNKQATILAESVYSHWENSATKLTESALIFEQSSNTIKDSQFSNNLVTATTNLANTQLQFAEIATLLNNNSQPLELAINNLLTSVQQIINLTEKIDGFNQKYTDMTDLSKQILLRQGDFLAEIKNNHQQNISTLQENQVILKEISQDFRQAIETLKNNEQQMISGLNKLGDRLEKNLLERIQDTSKQVQDLATNLSKKFEQMFNLFNKK